MATKYKIYLALTCMGLSTGFASIFVYYTLKNPPLNYLLAVTCFLACFALVVITSKMIAKAAMNDSRQKGPK